MIPTTELEKILELAGKTDGTIRIPGHWLREQDLDYVASLSPDRITEIVKELIELRKFVAISRDTVGSWLSASLSCGSSKEMKRDVRAWFDAFPKGYF